ncbi:MAG: hypothetical protein D6814_13445, partial [Calditrichaeota bacterium]
MKTVAWRMNLRLFLIWGVTIAVATGWVYVPEATAQHQESRKTLRALYIGKLSGQHRFRHGRQAAAFGNDAADSSGHPVDLKLASTQKSLALKSATEQAMENPGWRAKHGRPRKKALASDLPLA